MVGLFPQYRNRWLRIGGLYPQYGALWQSVGLRGDVALGDRSPLIRQFVEFD